MKTLSLFSLIIFSLSGHASSSLKQRYPHGLLTKDYGILDENDLLADTKDITPYPYDINKFQPGYMRWQCFPTRDTKFTYDKWKGNDPWGSASIIVDMCAFGFYAQSGNILHSYTGRRAYRIEFCKGLQKKWKQLTKNESYVCLNGSPDSKLAKAKKGESFSYEKDWTWNQFKTKKGCHYYFQGGCK